MKVFISYAREDFEIARKLRDDLEKAGIKTWLDKEDLLPGQKWRTIISKEIRECSHFLALLSSKSLSTRGFVQKELKMALDMLGEFPDDEIFVIPVRIEECEPADEQLKEIHWADLFPSYEKGFQDILRVLSQYQQDDNIPDSLQTEEDVPEKKTEQDEVVKLNEPVIEDNPPQSPKEAEKPAPLFSDTQRKQKKQSQPLKTTLLIAAIAVLLIVISINSGIFSKSEPPPKYNLRSKLMTVSHEEAESIFKLRKDSKRFSFSVWIPTEYIQNDFKDNKDGTITDHATGLMWQKSGSDNYMPYKDAPAYIEKLKNEKFAGYSDWRLPTVDELKSLLTSEKQSNDLYINPIFDKTQIWCWTSDNRASGGAWNVFFYNGNFNWLNDYNYVRAVRIRQ